jgi:hypothetical protein
VQQSVDLCVKNGAVANLFGRAAFSLILVLDYVGQCLDTKVILVELIFVANMADVP